MNRRVIFSVIGIMTGLASGLFAAEIILRVLGHQPISIAKKIPDEPLMLAFDPTLGWKNSPGNYAYPGYGASSKTIEVTIHNDGSRLTFPEKDTDKSSAARPSMIVLGGSFAFGWAVSDHQTFPWKLQKKTPHIEVKNYGVAGYGTYQSLLLLEQIAPRFNPGSIVLYAFIDYHLERNIADPDWLHTLEQYSSRGHILLPFVTLDNDGQLVRRSPENYRKLPFRHRSAFVAYLERTVMRTRSWSREKHAIAITGKLISQMKAVAENRNFTFITVILSSKTDPENDLKLYFDSDGIRYIDCNFERTSDLRVPNEGHPNEKLHALWAECIYEALPRYAPR